MLWRENCGRRRRPKGVRAKATPGQEQCTCEADRGLTPVSSGGGRGRGSSRFACLVRVAVTALRPPRPPKVCFEHQITFILRSTDRGIIFRRSHGGVEVFCIILCLCSLVGLTQAACGGKNAWNRSSSCQDLTLGLIDADMCWPTTRCAGEGDISVCWFMTGHSRRGCL